MPINTYTIPEGSHVHTTQVDFVSRPTQSIVHLVQYDTTLQIIEVALYSDRNKFIIPANADVFMRWSNKDRTFVYPKTLGCNKSRTSIYVEVSDKMTKTYGPSNPIIEISLNGKVAGSQSIPVYVERNPVQSGDVESSDGYKDYMDGVLSQIQNIISSGSGDDYIVKSLTLFAPDEVYALIAEIQKTSENEEIKVFEKSNPVVLENFNGSVKRIIVDLSDITSSNTDRMIFNCGVNSTYFGQVTASFSWFTGSALHPCMNIFALTIGYDDDDDKYALRGFRIWHSGYSALKSGNN